MASPPDDRVALLRDNDYLRDVVRAIVRKAGGRVVLTADDFREADRCCLECVPAGEALHVRAWPSRPANAEAPRSPIPGQLDLSPEPSR